MQLTIENIIQNKAGTVDRLCRKYSLMSNVPIPEIKSRVLESLWTSLITFNPDKECSFDTWSNRKMNQSALDVIRNREGTYYRKTFCVLDAEPVDEDKDAPSSEIPDDYNIEDHVLKRLYKKKEADQRQLIDFLLESTTIQSDPVMVAAIDGIMRGETVNAIAKSLGLPRNTVDRKLKRLARFYDPDKHGDIRDYLPDCVRIKREFINEAV